MMFCHNCSLVIGFSHSIHITSPRLSYFFAEVPGIHTQYSFFLYGTFFLHVVGPRYLIALHSDNNGVPGVGRTHNLRLRRPLHYPLCYGYNNLLLYQSTIYCIVSFFFFFNSIPFRFKLQTHLNRLTPHIVPLYKLFIQPITTS